MSGFLLDTSVLSALAPDRPRPPEHLRDWIRDQGERDTLFLSSIVVGEIQRGIAKLRRAGGIARADRLEGWLEELLTEFDDRIIDVDAAGARDAGQLEDALTAIGCNPGLADVLIAAAARRQALTVLTVNTRHFVESRVSYLNPFVEPLPGR